MKISPFPLLLSILLTSYTLEAKIPQSKYQGFDVPAGAFWISNHWKTIKGFAQSEPVNWRSVTGFKSVVADKEIPINKKGLDTLYVSGSASPSLANMLWLKNTYGKKHPVYIIDLRQETHIMINGLPISIFYKKDQINWGKPSSAINNSEQNWVQHFRKQNKIVINKLGRPVKGFKVAINPSTFKVKESYSEKTAADKAGLGYFRIVVPDYHPPSPDQVDQFLSIMNTLPKNAWLHFHCAAGKGRTTTFMIMKDILSNGQQISLKDIIYRQAKLGGINLLAQSSSLITQPWKDPYHKSRVDFIHLFYSYINTGIYTQQSFAQWISRQPEGPYKSIIKTDAYEKTM